MSACYGQTMIRQTIKPRREEILLSCQTFIVLNKLLMTYHYAYRLGLNLLPEEFLCAVDDQHRDPQLTKVKEQGLEEYAS